jgi:hypothetical protein
MSISYACARGFSQAEYPYIYCDEKHQLEAQAAEFAEPSVRGGIVTHELTQAIIDFREDDALAHVDRLRPWT